MTADLAWLAGFYEGEGTLRINRAGQRNLGILHASTVSTEQGYIEEFQRRWPGSVRLSPARGSSRQAWRWNLGSTKVGAFLDDIGPYIVGERMVARIVIARQFLALKASRSTLRAPEAYRRESFDHYLAMRELNARGPDGPDPDLIAVLATCPHADTWRS